MFWIGTVPGTSEEAPGVPGGTPADGGPFELTPGAGAADGAVAEASAAGCFRGRPLPGPGRRVMGFSVGSIFRGLSPGTPFSALF